MASLASGWCRDPPLSSLRCCGSPGLWNLSVHGVLADGVEDPVHFGGPAAVVGVIHLLHEVVQGLLLSLVQGQGFTDVGDVIEGLQLGHPGAQHHGEQVDEEVGMLTNGQVGLIAHLLEPEKQIRRENVEESVYTIPLVASEFSSLKKSVPSIHLAIEIYSLC